MKVNNISPSVDIIIVRYNTPEYDIDCINSIICNTNYHPYHIYLYDNFPINYKLSFLWNTFIKKSDSKYICLLNNDTSVTQGWLNKMMETMLSSDKVGVVGPSTNNCGSPQKVDPGTVISSDNPETDIEVDMEKTYGKQWQLSGFCLLIRKQAWEKVGGFSNKYRHYGQENEFLHMIQKAGYKTIWRKSAFIFHEGKATSKKIPGFDDMAERVAADKIYKQSLKNV